jgi:hypothetical protein
MYFILPIRFIFFWFMNNHLFGQLNIFTLECLNKVEHIPFFYEILENILKNNCGYPVELITYKILKSIL